MKLGMPHLNYNGIDPIWLLKDTANEHWNLLGEITPTNIDNERLYASFFACEIDFIKGQDYFKENNVYSLDSDLYKFNNQIYRSVHQINCNNNVSAIVTLDSIFVKKELNSGVLIKDAPTSLNKEFKTTDVVFLKEHKELKKKLSIIDSTGFKELAFSPESYFNAVKILYFANYVNLVLLSEYLTFQYILSPLKKLNIFYFGNINPTDKVYGQTVRKENMYETTLVSNNKVISFCKTLR